MSKILFLISLCGLVGCTDNKYSLIEQAQCDGDLQSEEEEVDDLFDRDGDGYFDGANPDCEATYGPELLDCDDANPEVSPGKVEVECDDIDNDCNEEVDDGVGDIYFYSDLNDFDGDGIPNTEEEGWLDFDNDNLPDSRDFDDDNDGVVNQYDLCPATPLGSTIDSAGCSASHA